MSPRPPGVERLHEGLAWRAARDLLSRSMRRGAGGMELPTVGAEQVAAGSWASCSPIGLQGDAQPASFELVAMGRRHAPLSPIPDKRRCGDVAGALRRSDPRPRAMSLRCGEVAGVRYLMRQRISL